MVDYNTSFPDEKKEFDELKKKIESGIYSLKSTKKTNAPLEEIISELRDKEKWVPCTYPLSIEEDDSLGYLSLYVCKAANKWIVVDYVKLKRSNITGDYIAELQFDNPKQFNLNIFKQNLFDSVKDTIFMYNSMVDDMKTWEEGTKIKAVFYIKIHNEIRKLNVEEYLYKNR